MNQENVYLITSTGRILPLSNYGVSLDRLADIPVNYEASQGYGQHGETIHDWRLNSREIRFTLPLAGRDRSAYWQRRAKFIDVLRPNVGDAMTLRIIMPDGQRRAIDGWLAENLGMLESRDSHAADVSFYLRCPDPTFYDPVDRVFDLAPNAGIGFAFPFSSPFSFSSSTALSYTVNNTGTWRSYPIITVDGPYTQIRITNSNTGGSLVLGATILAGEQRIIDLTPGRQSILDDNGNDYMGDLASGNLLNWYLRPGSNLVSASISGDDPNTNVTITYKRRYIAL